MTNLIGISGKLQSGKDTVTKLFNGYWIKIKALRYPLINLTYIKKQPLENVKLTDKLKDMVCLLLGCTREQLEDPKSKEKN